MDESDIESIERATLAAVPPQAVEEVGGWLLAFDDGTVGRCHSAVPLAHAAPPGGLARSVGERYRERGFAPVWRVPRLPAFAALQRDLTAQGLCAAKPTQVHTGTVAAMRALADGDEGGVRLAEAPGTSWSEVFLGEGFDPVDGASRLRILGRARESVFAAVEMEGRVAAVGSACFAQGWCGVHGMRTAPAFRRQGHAARILAALAGEAQRRGIARCFLQVEGANEPAQALYRRAGFEARWVYEYWR